MPKRDLTQMRVFVLNKLFRYLNRTFKTITKSKRVSLSVFNFSLLYSVFYIKKDGA